MFADSRDLFIYSHISHIVLLRSLGGKKCGQVVAGGILMLVFCCKRVCPEPRPDEIVLRSTAIGFQISSKMRFKST